jgi:hypothetical protein
VVTTDAERRDFGRLRGADPLEAPSGLDCLRHMHNRLDGTRYIAWITGLGLRGHQKC